MNWRPLVYTALLVIILMCGCQWSTPRPAGPGEPPQVIRLSYDPRLPHGPAHWVVEARKRFDNALVVQVHGGYRDGVWTAIPDDGPLIPVRDLAAAMKLLYPGRPLVLVICNTRGHDLHLEEVYYAKGLVWTCPRRGWPLGFAVPLGAGDIRDFRDRGGWMEQGR